MAWELAGKHVMEIDDALVAHDASEKGNLAGQPAEINDENYLVHDMHLVPYYPPSQAGNDSQTRERLNIELCDRVFRISDARDVARNSHAADEAINALMQSYEKEDSSNRGTGRVLFARIVSRIHNLSQSYLELRRAHNGEPLSDQEREVYKRIHDLYHYVMISHREIFSCVRLYDHSVDYDGIIEEVFSEIGKTQQLPIETIYANRVIKIGAAMAGIAEVTDIMTTVLSTMTTLPLDEMRRCLRQYSALARRLVGIPSSEHFAYDEVASQYVSAHDAMRDAVTRLNRLNVMRGESHYLAEWLQNGINLIHSMQNLRDRRHNSIEDFHHAALRWTEPESDILKLAGVG